MNDADLAALVLVIRDSLVRDGQPESAGILTQAARRIATGGEAVEGCERCGKPLEQKPAGRPAKFCSDRCRLAAWRETKGGRSVA